MWTENTWCFFIVKQPFLNSFCVPWTGLYSLGIVVDSCIFWLVFTPFDSLENYAMLWRFLQLNSNFTHQEKNKYLDENIFTNHFCFEVCTHFKLKPTNSLKLKHISNDCIITWINYPKEHGHCESVQNKQRKITLLTHELW